MKQSVGIAARDAGMVLGCDVTDVGDGVESR